MKDRTFIEWLQTLQFIREEEKAPRICIPDYTMKRNKFPILGERQSNVNNILIEHNIRSLKELLRDTNTRASKKITRHSAK